MGFRIGQRSFNGGIFSPEAYARDDYQKHGTGLKDAVNMQVLVQGAAQNRAGFEFVGGYDNTTAGMPPYLIPFQFSNNDSYQLEFVGGVMRVLKAGAYVLTGTALGLSSLSVANPAVIAAASGAASVVSSGNLAYISDPNGTSRLHGCVVKVTGVTANNISFTVIGDDTVDNSGSTWGTFGAGATIQKVYELAVSETNGVDMATVQTVQDIDTVYFAGLSAVKKLVRIADDNWTWSSLTVGSTLTPPALSGAAQPSGHPTTVEYYYLASSVNDAGEESLVASTASTVHLQNDLSLAGNYNTLTITAVSGASYYNVYRARGSASGFAYVGSTSDLTFTDDNISADYTRLATFADRDPFAGSGNLPTVIGFADQRLTFASTANNPQSVEMSSSTNPENFNRSPSPRENEAITFRMRSQKLDAITAIVPNDPILIFTKSAEFTLQGGDNKGYLTPGNPMIRPKTYRGSASYPQPALIDASILHVLTDRNTIYEMLPNAIPRDVTVLCRHLFIGKAITSWAYVRTPHSMLWVTMDDGSLLGFTYDLSQQVWGWTRHTPGGTASKVLQVSAVREGAYDRLYAVIQRTLYGKTVNMIERMDTRQFTAVENAFFVDAGYSYSGAATTTLRGLVHLRGETVQVLADGGVVQNIVVSNEGVLTVPNAATVLQVGFGYDAYVVTAPLYAGMIQGIGDSSALYKEIGGISITVSNSRGWAVGREGEDLDEIKQFTGTIPIPTSSGTFDHTAVGDWSADATIKVLQAYPLPLTITKLIPMVEISDDLG